MNTTKREFVLLTDKFAKILFNTKVGQKYLTKTKGNYLQPVVNLRGVSGEYALFLVVNEDYYNLDKTYKF